METLVIEAAGPDSAKRFSAALAAFPTAVVDAPDGHCRVEIRLGAGPRELIAVLNAIEACVSCGEISERVELTLGGRNYSLYPCRPAKRSAESSR